MGGLASQKFAIPLAAGLNQKADPRALEVPAMTICTDAQFDEIGGVQTRYPYAALGSDIFGGGTLTDVRRIVANGSELLCFTETEIYSWNAQLSQWVLKGEHLAVKVEEASKFVTTGDQVATDRAELDDTVLYAWVDGAYVYAAAMDKTTGSVLVAPYQIGPGARPRLVALDTAIMLFFHDSSGINEELAVLAIDPTDVAAGLAANPTALLSGGDFSDYYDVTRVIGQDQAVWACRRTLFASYEVGTVTAGLVAASTTKALQCIAPIAVACDPTGTSVMVFRDDADIKADLITISTLADVTTDQLIKAAGGSPYQIAAAFRSALDDGFYRCYVFWSTGVATYSNWVDTNGTIDTASTFITTVDVASRAFDHDGSVYLWTAFTTASEAYAGAYVPLFSYALQNTYFLYRDDRFLVAKAASGRAGAAHEDVPTAYHLAGVASVGGNVYTFCGIERRVIPIGGGGERRSKYGARAPRDITFTFDSDEARRTARIGQALYLTGGEILQYDGAQLTEVGFHLYPYTFGLVASTGSMADGTYAYRQTWRWDNAHGEIDRSTTATTGQITLSGGPKGVNVIWGQLTVTHKTNRAIAVETWRTPLNPTSDAPFYLVTSKDPAVTSNPNLYLENDQTAAAGFGTTLRDALADSALTVLETSAENGGVLEPLSPPAATIIAATSERLFLAGVAGDPDRVWYSRLRGDGEVASFHDALTVNIPRPGGDITALAFLNETLIVFRETAIYALAGEGFDNLGGGQNYGPARALSIDVGATNHESVALADKGLIFKSAKGWYLLNKGWSTDYIGAPVCDYDDEDVLAVHVMESQHQIRCLTGERMLVLDTLVNQWAEWSIAGAVHAAIWQGAYHYLQPTIAPFLVEGEPTGGQDAGPMAEQTTYSGVDYGMDLETAWIPLGQIQGFGRVWKAYILGEYRSACRVRIRLAKNYLTTYFQDKYWTVSPTTVGGPLQLEHRPSTQEMQAIKIRITAQHVSTDDAAPTGEALKLTSLALELGIERGLHRLPAAQRQ